MLCQPTLETARLVLRPFRTADADAVQRLAGDRAVAAMTLNIPHPYEDGMAEKWISNHRDWFERQEQAVFAVTLRECSMREPCGAGVPPALAGETPAPQVIGCVSLRIKREDQRAELGYWIGRAHWGQGYCTEAVRAVLEFGFGQLGLNRIFACHFARNPASGRVMQKAGMSREGCLRRHAKKWDAFEDVEIYAALRGTLAGAAAPGRMPS